jgi:hypothetical protein
MPPEQLLLAQSALCAHPIPAGQPVGVALTVWQSGLQGPQGSTLPSSHASPDSGTRLPHTGPGGSQETPAQLNGSAQKPAGGPPALMEVVQAPLVQSLLRTHPTPGSQAVTVGFVAVQLALHGPQGTMFPSSHVSPGSTTPFPQSGGGLSGFSAGLQSP